MCPLPAVPADVQRLVLGHPVDVRLGVAGGLTVQDGCVTLVHRCVLWFHLKADVHYMCTNTHIHRLINPNLTVVKMSVKLTNEFQYFYFTLRPASAQQMLLGFAA